MCHTGSAPFHCTPLLAQALVPAASVTAGLTREAFAHLPDPVAAATLCMRLSLVLQDAVAARVCAVASASIINKSGDFCQHATRALSGHQTLI